mgnify:CR=1 FL=1
MNSPENDFLFIVGSPRSGTTILGEILDLHPEINQWYEPYFVWDKYFRLAPDDERSVKDATGRVRRHIRKNFQRYRSKCKCRFIVDKSPRNSLKIPFIRQIFPGARFVHIIRDGRDATLSINREWNKRKEIVEGSGDRPGFNYTKAFHVIRAWLNRHPFWMDRLRALWFETHGHIFNKARHLNRLRWHGQTGWGPRFRDWEQFLAAHTVLQFNAMQWNSCVRSCLKNLEEVEEGQKLTLRYEDFVRQPDQVIERILHFIGAESTPAFFNKLPDIKAGNFNKWRKAFSSEQIEEIRPILTPTLDELGYLDKWPW